MDKIEWPLNEPIETESPYWTATLLFRDADGICAGYKEHKDGTRRAGIWRENGVGMSVDSNLIPPKPKARTKRIVIDWMRGAVWSTDDEAFPPDASIHTITHPDDVKPITREDISKAIGVAAYSTSSFARFVRPRIDNILALLRERGIYCEGGE